MHRKSLAFFVSNASTKIVFAADASVADGLEQYRGGNKGLFVLVSRTQAGPGRAVKQEQEEISRNHVQTFISPSVETFSCCIERAHGIYIIISSRKPQEIDLRGLIMDMTTILQF